MKRVREKSEDQVEGTMSWVAVQSGSKYFTNTHLVSGSTFLIEDVSTPNFFKRSKAGEIIVSPCTMVGQSVKSGGGTIELTRKSDGAMWWQVQGDGSCTQAAMYMAGVANDPDFGRLVDTDLLLRECKQQALSNIDKTPYGFAEDLAEIRETIEFVKSPLKGVRNSLLKMRKAVKKTGNRLNITDAEAFAQVWLEYRFALSPLIRSISDAIEAASKDFSAVSRPYYTGRYRMGSTETSSTVIPPSANFGFSVEKVHEVVVSAGVYYETTNPIDTTLEALGIRLKDVPETLWAVFPLSFMVDRVLNISAMIRGLRALSDPDIRVLNGWQQVKERIIYDIVADDYVPTSTLNQNIDGDHVIQEYFTLSRSRWYPGWRDTLPQYDLKGLVESIVEITDLITIILSILKVSDSGRTRRG